MLWCFPVYSDFFIENTVFIGINFTKQNRAVRKGGTMARQKKGFTLMELSIVIALVAIAVVMVSTFCIMADRRNAESNRSIQVTNDITVTEVIVENWIDELLSKGAALSLSESGDAIVATLGEDSYELSFTPSEENGGKESSGKLLGEYIDTQKSFSYTTSTVKAISFSMLEKEGARLITCAVTYDPSINSNPSKIKTYAFCVNSRIGETVELSEVTP